MNQPAKPTIAAPSAVSPPTTAFGCPRDFLNNRFIYFTVSARARGLSVGVNMNPDKNCNFDCVYCEVDRRVPPVENALDIKAMTGELERTLEHIRSGALRQNPSYAALPAELLELKHVALSGDGEPTLCPNFAEALQSVVHVRARGPFPFFKIVLITNGSALDDPNIEESLNLFTESDEIWIKLDAGTQAFMSRIDGPNASLSKVLSNILAVGKRRPVVIQSMFLMLDGHEPPAEEIAQYIERLKELKNAGAAISLVQVYSPARPIPLQKCTHLPLRTLSGIAKKVREATGLRAEVY